MAAKGKMDAFANLAAVRALETVAGTIAYTKFAFPYSVMDKVALLISRIEYFFGSLSQFNSTGDEALMGLIAATAVVDPTNQADPVMLDSIKIERYDAGAAASAVIVETPYVKDFSSLPGGGILVAPSPLSAFIRGAGAAGVVGAWVRLYYTYMELSTEEYWQLVESRRVISS